MVEAYTALGTSLAAQQRYDEAIREFQAAVVFAPPNAAHLPITLGTHTFSAARPNMQSRRGPAWFK
jgi:hypothetical protein